MNRNLSHSMWVGMVRVLVVAVLVTFTILLASSIAVAGITNFTATQLADNRIQLDWRGFVDPVSGICGSANGTTVTAIPTKNLCNDGSTPEVAGTGPWSWTCGDSGSGEDAHCIAYSKNAPFTVATLAGSWYVNGLVAGPDAPWWGRGSYAMSGNGTVKGTFVEYDDKSNPISGKFAVSSQGVITASSPKRDFRCTLDTARTVSVCTETWSDSNAGNIEIMLHTRKAGAYSQADLTGMWEMNSIGTPGIYWGRGPFTVASDGSFTGTINGWSGTSAQLSGSMTIDNAGVVAMSADIMPSYDLSTMKCVMDSLKTVIVCTYSHSDIFGDSTMMIFSKKGAAYSAADLAGVWNLNSLAAPNAWYGRGMITFDRDSGYSSTFTGSDAVSYTRSGDYTLTGDGIITLSDNPTMRCSMDALKRLVACTATNAGDTDASLTLFTSTDTPLNAQCGTANDESFSETPAANLCKAGTASEVDGTGPWTWICLGTGGGKNVACAAHPVIADGVVINDDVPFTNTVKVTLKPGQHGSKMRFSTDGTRWSRWVAYKSPYSYTLPTGDGVKSVYVQFGDSGAMPKILGEASDTITHDTKKPLDGKLTAVPSAGTDNSLDITWTPANDIPGSDIYSYKLYYSATGIAQCTGFPLVTIFDGAPLSYTHTGLSAAKKHSYRVCATDNAGNISAGATGIEIPTDTTAPSDLVILINTGAIYMPTTTVTLALSATDAGGVASVCISNLPTTPEKCAWKAYSRVMAWRLSKGDGEKTVYVRFRDTKGNISDEAIDTIILDTIKPTNGALKAMQLINNEIELEWSGFDDATSKVTGYKLVRGTKLPASCLGAALAYPASDGISYTDTGTKGVTYYYRLCAVDNAGNMSSGTAALAKAVPELTKPTGSVVINNAASYTNKTRVTLDINASDSSKIAAYCISNTGTCSAWIALPTAVPSLSITVKSWTLSPATNGEHTVTAWFRDVWGNISEPVTDSIIIDTLAPKGTVIINNGDASTIQTIIQLTLVVQDEISGSGLDKFSYSFDKNTWSDWENITKYKYVTLPASTKGTKYVYVRYRDIAGNTCMAGDSIVLITQTITGGSFWVHVKHLRNNISYISNITPTFRFVLINSSGSRSTIEAYRCLNEGNLYGGKYYSEWIIDKLSLTGPAATEWITYADYAGRSRRIPAWYPVQLPVGFNPVTYIIGYGTYVPFSL